LYARLAKASDIEADQVIADDRVINRGTLAYFKAKRAASGVH
ncbi:MAG: hypothetical protein JWR49_798, partial [Tardiphaga sp.]|nr:hypothetical protein [Tardiphaga sp.]